MDAIFLSGQSLYNRDWIKLVEKKLKDLFSQTRILEYDHWQNGGDNIDFEKEYAKLPKFISGFSDYVVIAKSIGTVLIARGIYDKILTPKKCIFLGPAWSFAQRWIENYSIPTLFVTKTNDPVAPAGKLRDLLEKHHVQKYQFIELPGDDHKYDDIEEIKTEVKKFIK